MTKMLYFGKEVVKLQESLNANTSIIQSKDCG